MTADARTNLLNLTPAAAEEALRAFAVSVGEAPYRGAQAARHLWMSPAADFTAMSDLPAGFRAKLAERFTLPRLQLAGEQRSRPSRSRTATG
jgi:adenine C2-methylase RlmN of 23S rRNA A2503 and tRNA A37